MGVGMLQGITQSQTERSIFSVSEFNRTIKQLIEESMGGVWVQGEVSNLVKASSGHKYFSIKDDKAQIRCAFFRGMQRNSSSTWEEGSEVILFARPTIYELRGDYQLVVESVELAGVGELQRAFEALKKKLHKQGIFDVKHKQALPEFPKRVAVITSATGAAVRDIIKVMQRRSPHTELIIYPSYVQGAQAAGDLVAMIQRVEERNECDVIILARGGGSLEDLWPFNEEVVAHAIFDCSIPVVSGVGHEIDVTIADLVADVRAATPSAAAELVAADRNILWQKVIYFLQQLQYSIDVVFERSVKNLHILQQRIRSPQGLLQVKQQNVDHLHWRLQSLMQNFFISKQQSFHQVVSQFEALSPLKTLQRGFSVVQDLQTNQVIRSIKKVKAEQHILIHVADGEFKAIVSK